MYVPTTSKLQAYIASTSKTSSHNKQVASIPCKLQARASLWNLTQEVLMHCSMGGQFKVVRKRILFKNFVHQVRMCWLLGKRKYRISSNKRLSPNKRPSSVSDKLNVINAPLFWKKKHPKTKYLVILCVHKFTILGKNCQYWHRQPGSEVKWSPKLTLRTRKSLIAS